MPSDSGPPAAPEVTAAPADGQVTLSWQAVTGAASYKVYQGTSDNEVQSITEGTSAVITGLTNDQTYSFWVAAVSSGGRTLSAEVTAAPRTAVPPAVTGLRAAAGNTQMVLTWTASTHAGVTGYKIRQTVDSTETEIDVSGRAAASHTVTGLTNGTAYSFTIAAVAGSSESAQSNAVTATPQATPHNVRAAVSEDTAGTAGSRQQVVLSWDVVGGAVRYKVYQDSSEIAGSVTGTTHTVSGLTDGQSYSFTVSFVDSSSQESVQSAAVVTCNFTDADGDGLTEICTLDHLQQINTDATTRRGNYELVRNLDFSDANSYAPSSSNWTSKTWRPVNASTASSSSRVVAHGSAVNAGWAPISVDASSKFSGSFNGRGYRIENLYVRRNVTGLFGQVWMIGVVRNVHVHGNVYGTAASDQAGHIAGINEGIVIASSSSGTADILADGNELVGGLVGQSSGTIAASYSTVSVNGGATTLDVVGGLVGQNSGTIVASYATGTADGGTGASDIVGGLVGKMASGSTVIASYATGAVSNAGSSTGGSLIGNDNLGTVTESYGYGTVGVSGGTPNGEKALTAGAAADGSTNAGTSWKANVWDFGTSSQSPRLKWVTAYNKTNKTFSCDVNLLPAGQSCGAIIPGQPAR